MASIIGRYLRTDEELETADAMKMAAQHALRVSDDLYLWRWVILALHNAAQGAMVLSLRHGNGLLALSDDSYAAWMEAYARNSAYPEEKLDTYLGLYKKVKHREIGQLGQNIRFAPHGTEGSDIKRLNTIRNEFIHFTPKSWSLEVSGLPQICLSVSRLVSFLAIETTNVSWHKPAAREELIQAHTHFTSIMRTLQASYDGKGSKR